MSPSVPKPPAKVRAAKKRPNPINTKRRKSEWARCYGSKERVAFVKSLPCCAGFSGCHQYATPENAHIKTGGTGRKADADQIVPLCGHHHAVLHELGRGVFEVYYRIDLKIAAAETERLWLQFNHPDGVTER